MTNAPKESRNSAAIIDEHDMMKMNIKGVFQIWMKDGSYHEIDLKECHKWTRRRQLIHGSRRGAGLAQSGELLALVVGEGLAGEEVLQLVVVADVEERLHHAVGHLFGQPAFDELVDEVGSRLAPGTAVPAAGAGEQRDEHQHGHRGASHGRRSPSSRRAPATMSSSPTSTRFAASPSGMNESSAARRSIEPE